MDYVKTPNDILHGDEHLEDKTPIRKEWIDYKVLVVWDDGSTDDVADQLYLGKNCMDIAEQLDLLADEMEANGEWGYENNNREEHF